MCLPCLPLAGDLPASKTHAVRRWAWVRNADPAALADGVLTITLRRSAKPGVKSEDDSYDVAEQPEAVRGWRRFFLVNRTDPKQKDVYEVVLGGRGDTCTCDAGKFKLPNCKHRDALRAVAAAGGFERAEIETVPAPLVPAEECLICGELLTGADVGGEVHAECEAAATDLLPPIPEVTPDGPLALPECFRGLSAPWEGVPF